MGQPYVDEGAASYESRYQHARIQCLATTAKELGYQLVLSTAQAYHPALQQRSLRSEWRDCGRGTDCSGRKGEGK